MLDGDDIATGAPVAVDFDGPTPSRVGPYRIIRLLGEGGMGASYEAEQARPRRRVALKMVRPGLNSPATLRRIEHEAQVLGEMRHPGIAQVFEAGVAAFAGERRPFFAMELVTGRPLDVHANAKRLNVTERLRLFLRVCDAVQHAHQHGVVHRDLKPDNILVTDDGQP